MDKGTILIADDEEEIVNVERDFLGLMLPQYSVECFGDGSSLATRLIDCDGVVAVVTDNDMPGVTGSEVIRRFAKRLGYEPVNFFLHYGGDESIGREAVRNGAKAYFLKPSVMSELVDAVKDSLFVSA